MKTNLVHKIYRPDEPDKGVYLAIQGIENLLRNERNLIKIAKSKNTKSYCKAYLEILDAGVTTPGFELNKIEGDTQFVPEISIIFNELFAYDLVTARENALLAFAE